MPPSSSHTALSFDPACDQCRLKKIKCGRETPDCLTCRRAGVACTFSSRGKRSSQSDKIINILEDLKSRLYSIEQTVSQLKAASPPSQSGTTTTTTTTADQLVSAAFVSSNHEMDEMSIDNYIDETPQVSTSLMNGEHLRSSFLASLIRDICLILESRLDSTRSTNIDDSLDKNIQECLATLQTLSKSFMSDDCWDLSSETLPPKLPPKGLLNASLEPYFHNVNSMLPIFDEDSFYDNIHKSYEAGSDHANLAWIVCLNNVCIQTLNDRTASRFTRKSRDEASSPPKAEPEAKVLTPFLINLKRAVGRLTCFHQQSMVSVQALMSMCLVTQDNFQYRLASILLQQACFVAKSIGLHQQNALSADQKSGENSQCLRVFWTLYVIDKSITSMLGQPCCMSLIDCNVSLPEKADLADPCLKRLLPRIELALIQEDANKRLPSNQPEQVETEQRSNILYLDKRLNEWAFKYRDIFEESPFDESPPASALSFNLQVNIVLTYHFHITRLMIYRSSNDPSDRSKCREDAVACVRLLQRLSGGFNSETGSVMLRECVRDHPLVPFFVLFQHAVQFPQSELSAHDLRLMVLATDILQRVPSLTRSLAYVTYLSSCCRAVAALIHKPTHVKPIASTEMVKQDAYSTNDPFAGFNDFLFDNDDNDNRTNDTNIDSQSRKRHIDDMDSGSAKNADSDSLGETLARGQNWLASFPPSDSLSTLVSPLPDSFSAPSWPRSYNSLGHIVSSVDLANGNYCTDSEMQHPLWLSTSTAPAAQLHHPHLLSPPPQPQQDKQGGWLQQHQQEQPQQLQQQQQQQQQPQQQLQQHQHQQQQPLWQIGRQPQQQQWVQEIGIGSLVPEHGGNMWGESWLN